MNMANSRTWSCQSSYSALKILKSSSVNSSFSKPWKSTFCFKSIAFFGGDSNLMVGRQIINIHVDSLLYIFSTRRPNDKVHVAELTASNVWQPNVWHALSDIAHCIDKLVGSTFSVELIIGNLSIEKPSKNPKFHTFSGVRALSFTF